MNEKIYEGKDRYRDPAVADIYDEHRFSSFKGRLTDKLEKNAVVRALKRARVEGPVLDIPCGTGRMTELLLRQGLQVTAGDISDEMMKFARKRARCFDDQIQFKECDIENMPFDGESFDLILTVRLLHHIPPELHPKIFSELHRVTRRWVLMTYSSKYSIQNLQRNIVSLITKFPRYSISPSLFRQEVTSAGFKIVEHISLMPGISESKVVLLEKYGE